VKKTNIHKKARQAGLFYVYTNEPQLILNVIRNYIT
jgi:hypothetical protein